MPFIWGDAAQRIVLLKQIPLFANLPETALLRLADDLQRRRFPKKNIIYRQGDPSKELYLIIEGKVRLSKTAMGRQEVSVMIASPYDLIGELGCIDHEPRSATVRTLLATTLLSLTSEAFYHYLRAVPDFALNFTRYLVAKARWTAAHAEVNAQYTATGRLVHVLLAYKTRYGQMVEPPNKYVIPMPLNQTDLATLVGVHRQWINQILSKWRAQKLIDYQIGQITLLDLPRLLAVTAADRAGPPDENDYLPLSQIE
jgi:CRP-like cAMP-binding protein